MDLSKDNGCFVCGPDNPRGLRARFTVDAAARTSCGQLTIPGWSQGWQGVVHGGILSTLLDEACVHAGRSVGPQPVTAELTVRFRRPVPVEKELTVRAEVTDVRRRVLQARGWLEVEGEICAEAEARLMLIQPAAEPVAAAEAE